MEHEHDGGRPHTAEWEAEPGNGNVADLENMTDPRWPTVRKVEFQPLPPPKTGLPVKGIAPQFHGVKLRLSAELGKIALPVQDLINLEEGSFLKLQRLADENVVILVNEAPFAHGEVVVINERFGVRVTALIESETPLREQKQGREG